MGYYSLIAPCFGCGRVFSSNPERVPSYNNEPICQICITIVNEKRAADGLPLWPVPSDAYEAASEDGEEYGRVEGDDDPDSLNYRGV